MLTPENIVGRRKFLKAVLVGTAGGIAYTLLGPDATPIPPEVEPTATPIVDSAVDGGESKWSPEATPTDQSTSTAEPFE